MPRRSLLNSPIGRILLFSGSSLNQANPSSGTLYSASADGAYVWTLAQPSSPDYLDQLRGGFRVQDISSDGLGIVNNGWEWNLEYQVDGTWTFSWYSVTSGTASAAIQTQTNIGTVTNVRVTLSGNSLSVETSANNGSSYTARGSTTSATYQTETGISASYTGQTGTDYVSNSDFSAWTAGAPDNWTESGDNGTTRTITQDVDGMRIISDTQLTPFVAQTLSSVSSVVVLFVDIHSLGASNRVRVYEGGFTRNTDFSATGLHASRVSGLNGELRVTCVIAPHDSITSQVSYLEVDTLDASGDGGFSQVVQS